jgi:putative ABC transport system permease protein
MVKYVSLVIKNLTRSKRRTILTILAIAISLFIFAILVSLPTFANQVVADSASSVRLACRTKMGWDYPLPAAYGVKIDATPHVAALAACVVYGGVYHDVSDQFPSLAMDADKFNVLFPDWGITGAEEFKQIKTSALVTESAMRRFQLHVGQQIQIRGTRFPFNLQLTIVGTIAKGPSPNFLVFRRDYFEEAAGKPGIVDIFWVRVDDSRNLPQVAAELDQQFANSSAETRSESEASFIGSVLARFQIFLKLAALIGVVVVVAIGLVAANTAAMSIRERRGEIAVMRAIGFRSRVIFSLLVAESLVMALVGGALGCGAAFVLLRVFSLNADVLGPFAVLRIPPVVLGQAMIVAIILGVFSAYVPALAASRRNIAESFRLID